MISFTGNLSRGAGENVGAYAIGQNNVANGNYLITYNGADLTITPKAITVTPNSSQFKIYGTPDPVFTYTANPAIGSNLPNNISVSLIGLLSRITAAGDPIGNYAILQGGINNSANPNYNITFVSGVSFEIKPAPVSTSVTVSPTSVQYSDQVTFTATIVGGAPLIDDGPQAAASVTFKVGSQIMNASPTSLTVSGSNIIAVLTVPMLETIAGQMAPGVKAVTAEFNFPNSNYKVSLNPASTSLTITQEDARLTFTGTSIVATASATSGLATVTLRATIQDITGALGLAVDGLAGDIRNARVSFYNGSTLIASGLIPSLVIPTDFKTGVVSYQWSVNILAATDVEYTISTVVSNYYTRNSSEDNTVVTVYKPTGDFITGGGFIKTPKDAKSGGTYASDANLGLKTNFGFNVKYNKNGTNLQGNMNIIIRSVQGGIVHTYQIKANAMTSLGVDITKAPVLKAVFVSKANLTDITNPLSPQSIGGNLSLQVNLTDNGEPGTSDQIAFSLWDNGNTLLYSNNWNGTNSIETVLGGGNLVVHSSASLNKNLVSPTNTTPLRAAEFGIKAYPNPFTDHITFDLQLQTDSKVRLEIYNINGTKLATVYDDMVVAYDKYQFEYTPENLSSGTLIYRLIINNEIAFTGKLIHK